MFTDHGQTAGTDQDDRTGRKLESLESLDNTVLQRFYRTFGLFAKSAFGEIIPDTRTDQRRETHIQHDQRRSSPKI